jgi:hypothetical protein
MLTIAWQGMIETGEIEWIPAFAGMTGYARGESPSNGHGIRDRTT